MCKPRILSHITELEKSRTDKENKINTYKSATSVMQQTPIKEYEDKLQHKSILIQKLIKELKELREELKLVETRHELTLKETIEELKFKKIREELKFKKIREELKELMETREELDKTRNELNETRKEVEKTQEVLKETQDDLEAMSWTELHRTR